MPNPTLLIACLIITIIACGCGGGYYQQSRHMMHNYAAGDLQSSLAVAQRNAERHPEPCAHRDGIVWRLEQASILRAMGEFEASNEAFAYADRAIDMYDELPEVSITAETAATFTNLNALPYRGFAYDRIMLSTYRALNAMKLGDMEFARVQLNRARERQRQAIERNQRRIDAAEQEAKEAKARGYLADEGVYSEQLRELGDIEIRFAELYQAQGQYTNPFTDFVHGLYNLYAGLDAGDRERGHHAMQRLAAMIGEENPFVLEDLAVAEDIVSGRGIPPTTYVIFETGRGPSREQVRIDIPLPVAGIDYVGAAFPVLVFHGQYERYLRVRHVEGTFETGVLSDMDTVVGLEFTNDLPWVTMRTIFLSAAQAAAQYGLHKATEDDAWANVLTRLGSSMYRLAQNQADRRAWQTLPKQVQYCRFETPADRTIVAETATGVSIPVMIEPGHVNVVYIKSISSASLLHVWQFKLQ